MPTNGVRRLYLSPFIVTSGGYIWVHLSWFIRHIQACAFLGQPQKQGCCLDEASPDYRLHYYHTVLQSAVQGRGPSSQNRQKERGYKSAHRHTRQWGSPFWYKVYICSHQRFFYVKAVNDIKFTSAATNDSFMLKPSTLSKGDIVAMDRAYIDYEKLEALTQREVLYRCNM